MAISSATIWEMSKEYKDPLSQGLTEIYANSSPLYKYLRFNNIPGAGESTSLEVDLGSVGFRGINEGWTPDMGTTEPGYWPLFIAGGEIAIDNMLIKTRGAGFFQRKMRSKTKAAGLKMASVFFLGNNSTNRKTPNGLKALCLGDQNISAGSTSGGDVLSLALLDDAISECEGENRVIFVNDKLQAYLSAAARSPTIGGNINYDKDDFGKRVMFYGGLPVEPIKRDNTDTEILAFDEIGAGGGSAVTCSLYVVGFGPDEDSGVYGVQHGPPEYEPITSSLPKKGTRMEWYANPCIRSSKRYAVRVRGIKKGAVVA